MTMEDSSVPFLNNAEAAVQSAVRKHKVKPLSLLPLVALIFYDVSGGPFGIEVRCPACMVLIFTQHLTMKALVQCIAKLCFWNSLPMALLALFTMLKYKVQLALTLSILHIYCLLKDAVSAGGPLLAILGFLILPLVWSVPEALITAELATTFPENSGYVAWVTAAFGPFWGFQVPAARLPEVMSDCILLPKFLKTLPLCLIYTQISTSHPALHGDVLFFGRGACLQVRCFEYYMPAILKAHSIQHPRSVPVLCVKIGRCF